MNIIFLAMAVHVSFKIRRKTAETDKNNLQWILGTVSLTFILGITWLFGFLFFSQESITLAYVFTILNSLQGFFIFIVFCVMNKKVRKDLHRQFTNSQVFIFYVFL